MGFHNRGGVYGNFLSQPLNLLCCEFSLIHQEVGAAQLVWGRFYFKKIVLYVAVDLVHLWEELSSGSYITISNWTVSFILLWV